MEEQTIDIKEMRKTNVGQSLEYLQDRLTLIMSRRHFVEGKSGGVVRKLSRKIRNLSK